MYKDEKLIAYCENDVRITLELFNEIERQRKIMKKRGWMIVISVLLVILVSMVIFGVSAFASEDDVVFEERNGVETVEIGEHNTAGFTKWINTKHLGGWGNYTVEYINGVWIVHDGTNIYAVDVEVITLYNPDTELISNYLNMDDWAYLALFERLPIRITYYYDDYVEKGWLRINSYIYDLDRELGYVG